MIKIFTFQRLYFWAKSSILICFLWVITFQVLAQQPLTETTDSLVVDSMIKMPNLQDRHVNLWYRTISKLKNVAGSSTIYSEDVNTTPVSSVTNALAGRITGLNTNQNSGRIGSLFDASSLTLRGKTPLIVVDGVIRPFINFNVDDIKSITVLKDAVSTSMFGLRSSNGVVYITTKDKSFDKPFELNFNAQFGVLNQLKRPNFITGANYAELYNEAQQNTFPGASPAFSSATIAAYQKGTNDPYLQPNNDWYNTIYKNNPLQKRYTVSAAGNGKSYRYYTAIEHLSQGGNFLSTDDNPYETTNFYKRYNLRTNMQIDFNEDIQLGLNIFGSIENSNEPGTLGFELMNRIYQTSPLGYAAKNPDGTYSGSILYTDNILASTINSGYFNTNQRTLGADISVKFKLDDITKGLWAKGLLSINNYYLQLISRIKPFAIYYPTVTGAGTTYTKVGTEGTIEAGAGVPNIANQTKQTFVNGLIGYDRTFGKHNLNILGTYNITNLIDSYIQLNQIYNNAGLTASYDYGKTYLAELGLVYSGYNRYESGNKWGFLPSLGLGWVISNEGWFKSSAIDFLKLRASIGQTAWADPIGYYSYIQKYNTGAAGYNFGASASAVRGTAEDVLRNQNITWEKAIKFDVGAEAQLFNNRLNLELNWYNNKYYDELIYPANGSSSGIIGQTYPQINAGKVRYTGFEANIGFSDQKQSFGYFIKGNFSIANNKIINRQEGNYPYPWMYQAGQPSAVFGYEAIGFYQVGEDVSKTANIPGFIPQPGDLKYADLNSDGTIDFLDQKAVMGTKPQFFFGFNTGFNYKGFDFSALVQGVLNREIYYNAAQILAFNNGYGYVLDYTTENRWTPQNTNNASLPRLTLGSNINNEPISSFWVKSADYIRLKNIEIGYTIPAKLLNKAKISKIRIFVNAYNPLTWTNLDYLDPETGLSGFVNYRILNGGISLKL